MNNESKQCDNQTMQRLTARVKELAKHKLAAMNETQSADQKLKIQQWLRKIEDGKPQLRNDESGSQPQLAQTSNVCPSPFTEMITEQQRNNVRLQSGYYSSIDPPKARTPNMNPAAVSGEPMQSNIKYPVGYNQRVQSSMNQAINHLSACIPHNMNPIHPHQVPFTNNLHPFHGGSHGGYNSSYATNWNGSQEQQQQYWRNMKLMAERNIATMTQKQWASQVCVPEIRQLQREEQAVIQEIAQSIAKWQDIRNRLECVQQNVQSGTQLAPQVGIPQ